MYFDHPDYEREAVELFVTWCAEQGIERLPALRILDAWYAIGSDVKCRAAAAHQASVQAYMDQTLAKANSRYLKMRGAAVVHQCRVFESKTLCGRSFDESKAVITNKPGDGNAPCGACKRAWGVFETEVFHLEMGGLEG